MAYSKILVYSIFVRFLCCATIKGQDPTLLYEICPESYNSTTTANNTFQDNLKTLLSSLSSKAIGNTEYYTAVTGVYGLFMCRGDISSQLCHDCITNATQKLSLSCPLFERAFIWYDECMVRYSNSSFFSTISTTPGVYLVNTANISNPKSFMPLLFSTMNKAADEAAQPHVGEENKKFATREANISTYNHLYCLAQCTPDLSPNDCRTCLSTAIGNLPQCCNGRLGGRVLFPSCNVRYELYPFYRTTNTSSPNQLVPETNYTKQDSRFSQDPFYVSYNCSSNRSTINDKNFKLLLSYMFSNATNGNKFRKVQVKEMVYGFFLCRGDLPVNLCSQCVKKATDRIYSECLSSSEGIIWYSHCLIRYSDQKFFSNFETRPMYRDINITVYSIYDQNLFASTLSNQLSQLANFTGDSNERYMTNSLKLNDVQTLYSLEQCTQELSSNECSSCLNNIIGTEIPWLFLGSVGGRVLYPNCNLRFELFQFYMDGDEAQPPTSPLSGGDAAENRKIIIIVVPAIILLILFFIGYYLLKRRGRKSRRTIILRKNFGEESATLEPLQFDWEVIEAATNNFSNDNYIGKGGFGEVYKVRKCKDSLPFD
ncbi:putative cysteine-rich receptor-like protein kinase 23 [Trifolium pratense]|uniref:putative cysteine-rich receptor-like protein kinase 23 n=1 Tax=Trifolium pratense TaxID=57577 RepID=UPI001E694C96|nr:putative cysteine-rich receptor-like protein kinase 23 [Trifolium pratense]